MLRSERSLSEPYARNKHRVGAAHRLAAGISATRKVGRLEDDVMVFAGVSDGEVSSGNSVATPAPNW